MFIVLPFCHKDEWLALKQLEWAKKLDGRIERTCLVVHDDTISGDEVVQAAKDTFSDVLEYTYPRWPGRDTAWPVVQNHQFQEAASYIHARGPDSEWFWWEPDCTPIKGGWIEALEEEYKLGGKLFMGHVVSGDPFGNGSNISWMTGCGVYPKHTPSYAGASMSSVKIPWDVAGHRDIIRVTHPANHLIQHLWAINGNPPTFASSVEAAAVINDGAVLFHRCKDGSLINALRGKPIVSRVVDAVKEVASGIIHPYRREAQSQVTAVITSHKRPGMMKAAFESAVRAGFTKIIVACSGTDAQTRKVLSAMSGRAECQKAIEFPESENSGVIWAKAVSEVRTGMVTILHDDDQFMPGLMDAITKPLQDGYQLIYWPAVFDNPLWPVLNEQNLSPGRNKTRSIINHLSHLGQLSISPVRGAYTTDVARVALDEAVRHFGSDFMFRPNFLVGNDMLLWFRAADSTDSFWNVGKPLVRLGTSDSTTVKDIASKEGKLKAIYERVRDYWNYSPKRGRVSRKIINICYVPDDSYVGLAGFIRNMEAHRAANPIIYFADHNGTGARKLGARMVDSQNIMTPRDAGTSIHFANMMRIADQEGADYFQVLEPDCRVGASMWDRELADAFFDWPFDAVAGGCPVVWNPFWGAGANGLRVVEYGSRYQKAAGVSAAWEGNETDKHPVVYPNGALGIWDITELKLLFPGSFENPLLAAKELKYYDHYVGVKFWEVYGDRVFDKIAWTTPAYSGCGDRWYTEAERINMLYTGKKIAVHQIKRDDV